jgi:tetratricopeptide (TPR) repeat protein
MLRIFLSYGRDEHVALAERLARDLESRGHQVWFDRDRLYPGTDWEAHIEQGLKWAAEVTSAGRFIILMTPHSVRRPNGFCLNELAAALSKSMDIVPIMVVWCEPPLSICRIQWLDMTDCTPVDINNERYEASKERLLQALEGDRLDRQGTHARLIRYLQPLDFSADIAVHLEGFVGRRWMIQRYNKWLNDLEASRIFWIVGEPGAGKTALAAYLGHKHREVMALHLCRAGHDDKSDPRRCVLSLSYQLATQLPDYRDRLAAMALSEEIGKSAVTLFDNLIVQPLTPPFPAPSGFAVLVIDGLDEASYNGRNELAEFLGSEFPRTPNWMRLVITSRPNPEVMQPLQGLTPEWLSVSSPKNLEDIRSFFQKGLAEIPTYNSTPELTDALAKRSNGLFLYARLVLQDLKEGRIQFDHLDQLPSSLGGIYARFFARQFPDREAYAQRVRPLLELIVAARGPLPISLAKVALGWTIYDCKINEDEEWGGEIIRALGSLILRDGLNLKLFHETAAEWLTNPSLAGIYYVDRAIGKARISDACLKEFHDTSAFPSEYTIANLASHLIDQQRWDDLLHVVTSNRIQLTARWIERGETEEGISCLTALMSQLEHSSVHSEAASGLATQLARLHSLRAEYEKAEEWLMKAMDRTSWLRHRRIRAVACHELGSLCLYRLDYRSAKRFYRKALRWSFWTYPRQHDESASNLIGLSMLEWLQYRHDQAKKYALRASTEAMRGNDLQHRIAAERLLGGVLASIGQFEEAESHLRLGLFLSERSGAEVEKCRIIHILGWLMFERALINHESVEAALDCFRSGLELALGAGDLHTLLSIRSSVARLALGMGRMDEAKTQIHLIEGSLPENSHLELHGTLQLLQASLVHQQGEVGIARERYMEAMRFCAQQGLRGLEAMTAVGLGALYWHSNQPEEAEIYWQRAMLCAEGVSQVRRLQTEARIELCKTSITATPF